MPFIFKTANPVEAGFVEDFFLKKGIDCHLIPSGGLYGLQGYDVAVGQEIDDALKAELAAHLKSQEVNSVEEDEEPSEAEESELASTVQSGREFSLIDTISVIAIGFLIFFGVYFGTLKWSDRWLSGMVTPLGANLLAVVACLTFVYACCRKKFGPEADSYLGLAPVSWRTLVLWVIGFVAFKLLARIVLSKFGVEFLPQRSSAVAVLIGPFFRQLIFYGFLLRALEPKLKVPLALIITGAAFVMHYYSGPPTKLAYAFAVALILGLARIKTRSILPGTAMVMTYNLVAFLFSY